MMTTTTTTTTTDSNAIIKTTTTSNNKNLTKKYLHLKESNNKSYVSSTSSDNEDGDYNDSYYYHDNGDGNQRDLDNNEDEDYDDDDDEKFYDAVEDTDSENLTCAHTNNNGMSNNHINNQNLQADNNTNNNDDHDDDDNDENYDETSEIIEHITDEKIDRCSNSNINTNCNSDNNEDNADDSDDVELETEWSFWFDKCTRGTTANEYEAGLKFIYTVKTAQKFWSVFNNIPDVSKLQYHCSYHLMRGNRKPLWEDEANARGGLWKFKCNKKFTSIVWRELLLAAIGEQFSDSIANGDEIIGVSVTCREKDDLIQIWNIDSKLESKATIFDKLEKLLPNVEFPVRFYKAHAIHDQSDNTKKNYQKNQK